MTMHWHEAVTQSTYGQAWRLDNKGRQVIRFADGRAVRSLLHHPEQKEEVASEEVDGFLDWTPLGKARGT